MSVTAPVTCLLGIRRSNDKASQSADGSEAGQHEEGKHQAAHGGFPGLDRAVRNRNGRSEPGSIGIFRIGREWSPRVGHRPGVAFVAASSLAALAWRVRPKPHRPWQAAICHGAQGHRPRGPADDRPPAQTIGTSYRYRWPPKRKGPALPCRIVTPSSPSRSSTGVMVSWSPRRPPLP
jgi:hypothetical protein